MPKVNQGAGLGALLGSNRLSEITSVSGDTVQKIPLDLIDPNPYQPRKQFDERKMADLAESIKKHGVLQPVLMRKKNDGRYELIAGERRFRASKIAGQAYIPANVKVLSDQESLEIALIENIQREDINPIETAMGYRRLMDEFNYTQEDLSKVIGKSRSAIANTLRLLSLPNNAIAMITAKQLTEGHGRCILSVPEHRRAEFAGVVFAKELSVRQAEELAVYYKNPKPYTPPTEMDAMCYSIKNELSTMLGVKVQITERNGKGKVTIPFDSLSELEYILNKLKGY
ncbi:MAG: ParB/RepB/Spo0J family partition protein [Armatimonadetes bacterium]|nr:ParB/RepB/Spo0J family partition protein [Candidatus Hippobium faecium]